MLTAGTEGIEILREVMEALAGTRVKPQQAIALVELGSPRLVRGRRSAMRSGVDTLMPSELRVARLATKGLTKPRDRPIVDSYLSKTVETHLPHVFQKLDVAKRTEFTGALGASR